MTDKGKDGSKDNDEQSRKGWMVERVKVENKQERFKRQKSKKASEPFKLRAMNEDKVQK